MRTGKVVIVEETYRGCYEVDETLSDDEAIEKVLEDIRHGREKGPDECCGSKAYVKSAQPDK